MPAAAVAQREQAAAALAEAERRLETERAEMVAARERMEREKAEMKDAAAMRQHPEPPPPMDFYLSWPWSTSGQVAAFGRGTQCNGVGGRGGHSDDGLCVPVRFVVWVTGLILL